MFQPSQIGGIFCSVTKNRLRSDTKYPAVFMCKHWNHSNETGFVYHFIILYHCLVIGRLRTFFGSLDDDIYLMGKIAWYHMIFPYPVGPMLAPWIPMGHELRLRKLRQMARKAEGCGSTNTKAKKVAVYTDYSDMTQHSHETMTPFGCRWPDGQHWLCIRIQLSPPQF